MIYSRDTIIHTFAEREELETTGISYAKFDENDKFDRIVTVKMNLSILKML